MDTTFSNSISPASISRDNSAETEHALSTSPQHNMDQAHLGDHIMTKTFSLKKRSFAETDFPLHSIDDTDELLKHNIFPVSDDYEWKFNDEKLLHVESPINAHSQSPKKITSR